MIDLEQAKKRVEEIADHFRAFQCLNRIDSDKLLTINHDLIREVERLEKICPFTDHISLTVHNQYTNNLQCEKAELEAGYNLRGEWLDHIQAYFGVEDHGELPAMVFLTLEKVADLQDKLEAQQKVIDALRKEVERLEKRWGESVDLVSEVEERAQKAEAQLIDLRAELTEAKLVVFEDDTVPRLKEKIAELREERDSNDDRALKAEAALDESKALLYRFACSEHGGVPPKSIYCSTCGEPMSKPASGM